MSAAQVSPPSHEDSTLSTMTRSHAEDDEDELSPPQSPSTHPSANAANPTLFSFLSTLALNDQGDHDESEPSTPATPDEGLLRDSPGEFDMAPEPSWEGNDPELRQDDSKQPAAQKEDEDEEDDFVGSLPTEDTLHKHEVFRTPSFDSSDLSKRLAQLSVSDLAGRPPPLVRQPSIGDGKGILGDGIIDEDQITDEEKMEAIIEQFGEIDTGTGEKERFLYEGKGGLSRGVIIIGNLHLTTHRMTFHAVLPPLSLVDSSSSASALILKSGPVWIHRPGRLTKKRRVWMELGVDMVTTYPDSSKEGRTRPLKSLMLSSIVEILPPDPSDPLAVSVKISSDKELSSHLEFDTLESALEWRREFSGALWHARRMRLRLSRKKDEAGADAAAEEEAGAQAGGYGKQEDWERIKISIPLDRIVKNELADYMTFATLVNLDIFTSSHGPCPTMVPAFSPQSSTSSLPVDHDDILHLQFALLSYQASFIDQFQKALNAARTRRENGSNALSCPPLLQMDGVFAEEIEIGRREDEDVHRAEPVSDDVPKDIESEGKAANAKLRVIFGLREGEALWSTACGLQRSIIPLRGHLIISPRYVGWYRHTIAGHDIKYRFLLHEVKGAVKASTLHLSTHGLGLQVVGHANTTFEFWSKASRNEAIDKINEAVAARSNSTPPASGMATPERPSTPTSSDSTAVRSPTASSFSSAGSSTLGGGRSASSHHRLSSLDILGAGMKDHTKKAHASIPDNMISYLPKIVNQAGLRPVDPTERKRIQPKHFVCLTIGSRGDVQPYIALALGLKKDGHRVTIVTHDEFKKWVESYGIEHRQAGGDPEALMKLSVEHKMFSPQWFKVSLSGFRTWLDELFHDCWVACQDAEVILESPSVFAGIHIAEALGRPYFRCFTMTWTRTQTYPHAFLVPPFEMSGSFNYSTYVMFDSIIWKAMSGQINKWRRKDMGLGPTDQSHLEASNVPFIYNFSPGVVPHPIDWKDNIYISGYWFLDDSDPDWSPPASLDAFIKKARDDGKALVYLGFGSIVVPHPAAMTRSIIKAVQKADVRAIIAKGWSNRGGEVGKDGQPIVVELPEDCCYSVEKVPHDWLFKQIDAAVHHGGAGTTGASLRAGLPTIIKPWFGDQFFWGNRVNNLGCGIKLTDLHSSELAAALTRATTDRVMREAASKIGEKIRAEKGVDNAIAFIYSYLGRAGDRHASYKPTPGTISASTANGGTSSPRTGPSPFSTAALTSIASSKLHALVSKAKDTGSHTPKEDSSDAPHG